MESQAGELGGIEPFCNSAMLSATSGICVEVAMSTTSKKLDMSVTPDRRNEDED